jgi:hypothetical protein
MNKTILEIGAAALLASLSAHAQLTSVDHGAAAVDGHGLMWANTVGMDLTWSATGASGSAQAWVAGLNTGRYAGFNDWTLASGNGSTGANTRTNQLGELFYTDCGNSLGSASVFNNPGRQCTALSAVNSVLSTPALFFSGSLFGTACCNINNTFWWAYLTPTSNQQAWNFDTSFGLLVGRGDALAVRAIPEIDSTSIGSGLALLVGTLAVLRGRPRVRHEGGRI